MAMEGVTLRTLVVAVQAKDGGMRILDRLGRPISRVFREADIGPVTEQGEERMAWRSAIHRMLLWFRREVDRSRFDPWRAKAEVLIKSIYTHAKRALHGNHPRFEGYKTTDWNAARERLSRQVHARAIRCGRSGWERWTYAVSRNGNRRAEDQIWKESK